MEAPSKLERRLVGALVKTAFLRDRRRAPPPAPAIAREVTFEGNTGARIAARWFAAEKPKGAVVLAHPDKRLAKAWFEREGHIQWLQENGFDVLTFDFPGYGASRGPATYYHEDVLAAFRFARDWSGHAPGARVGRQHGRLRGRERLAAARRLRRARPRVAVPELQRLVRKPQGGAPHDGI